MRIGFDITQAVKKHGRGIHRYIHEILPAFAKVHQDWPTTLCIRGTRWWQKNLAAELIPSAPRRWMPLDAWVSAKGLDHFHSFGNHLPPWGTLSRSFTIHDFRAVDFPDEVGASKQRLKRNIQRADAILCLTQHGRETLHRHYDFPEDRVIVVPHGVDHQKFCPQDEEKSKTVAAKFGLHRPFVMQLGSWFPHKNLELSLRGFAESKLFQEGFQLALIGGGASGSYQQELQNLVSDLRIAKQVHWINNVSGGELPPLIAAASCLLQPSRYEGFALPVLEAMAVGIPGVVADATCLPEVSAGVWPKVNPDDVKGWAEAMDEMVLQNQARELATAGGLVHAAGFTWEKTATLTGEFLQKAAELGRRC